MEERLQSFSIDFQVFKKMWLERVWNIKNKKIWNLFLSWKEHIFSFLSFKSPSFIKSEHNLIKWVPTQEAKVSFLFFFKRIVSWISIPHSKPINTPFFFFFWKPILDLQKVEVTLRVLFKPEIEQLPKIYSNYGIDYDSRILPS